MKTVYLKNHIQSVKTECLKRNSNGVEFSEDLIDNAIKAQVKNNLRYRKGKTYDDVFGVCQEYVHISDIPKYESNEECAKWEFSGIIRNSAHRLYKGLNAI